MNVFVVENSEISRERLQSILSGIPGITVIGRAAEDDPGVAERIDTLLPDVLIFDNLRNMAVVGMLKNIKKRHPMIKAMVLANCASELDFNCCKRAGADHFLTGTRSSCEPVRLYGNGYTIAGWAAILRFRFHE